MIDPSLVQFRMLAEVARRGTMAAAAQALGYTPSAVSQQLGQLQHSAGVDLFERVGRSIHLTDAGFDLARRADTILAEVEAAGAALESHHSHAQGEVHVGMFESVAEAVLPRMLDELARRTPDLEVRSHQVDPENAIDALGAGELDVVFTIAHTDHVQIVPDRFDTDVIARDRFRLVVPAGHPLTERRVVDLASIGGEPFIGSPPETSDGALVADAFRAAGVEQRLHHRFDDFRTVLGLVATGHGIALVPDLALCSVPDDVRVIDLDELVERTITLVCRRASAQRPAIRAVRDAVCRVIDDTDRAA